MRGLKKAELVEGLVIMPSPVKLSRHSKPHLMLVTWLGCYTSMMPKVEAADNGTVMLDFDNEYQPDAVLRLLPEHGGQSRTTTDDFIEGAPEMAVEVASSSASYDLHAKRHAYRRNGVREYLVWVTRETRLVWWILEEGEYVELKPDPQGVLKSHVFPGLWLDTPAMLAGDLATVLTRLQEGLASPEAAAFRA